MIQTKTERLFHLVNILRSGNGYRVAELARALKVSERTIYRYVVDLSEVVPIYYDKGYRILAEARLANMAFTREELLAVKLAFKTTELLAGSAGLTPAMRAALNKIEDQLSCRFGDSEARRKR
jgi:predicted DNA-binding transcriptional regulator YafY